MCFKRFLMVGLLLGGLCGPAAASDNAPVIVVPGKPGVPVIINGRDASWAIVEGDWGLYRPGSMPVTVIYPRPWLVVPPRRYVYHHAYRHPPRRHVRVRGCVCAPRHVAKEAHVVPKVTAPAAPREVYIPPAQRHYFPGGTTKPVLGRLEIEPKGPPKPAESFFREWSTESARIPADITPRTPVVVAPVVNGRRFPRRFSPPPPSPPPRRAANPAAAAAPVPAGAPATVPAKP